MPALNYQAKFAALVESGSKLTTIRLRRKDGRDPKPGDVLYHYTGMRTKHCRKLGQSICSRTRRITIRGNQLRINGKPADAMVKRNLAYLDGFRETNHQKAWEEMRAWFAQTHGLPFKGLLIEWNWFSIAEKDLKTKINAKTRRRKGAKNRSQQRNEKQF